MTAFAFTGAALVIASALIFTAGKQRGWRWVPLVAALLSSIVGLGLIAAQEYAPIFLLYEDALPTIARIAFAIAFTAITVLLVWGLAARDDTPRRAKRWLVALCGISLATATGFCLWEIHDLAWEAIEPWRDVDPG